jgi:8-oxo-dGTP pyrophosphatase MutT (NUDIX family)
VRREQVLAAVGQHRATLLPPKGLKASAVLVPLQPRAHDPSQLDILLTRRAADLGDHAGQVFFPGGRIDPGDADVTATALREMQEELGIPSREVEIIGRLDDMVTVTGYHIAPVVGLVTPAVAMQPNPAEVARVFSLPLDVLLDESGWRPRVHEWRGKRVELVHLLHDGEDIWGATAYMLRGLIEVLRLASQGQSR